jgi:GR25 family glycosyltransferase involved in LPS biosynthesis
MYGYLIDYCLTKNIKLDIYSQLDADIGWINFYKNTLIKNNKLINFLDIKKYPIKNSYDKVVLTTDDDTTIPEHIFNDKYICIDHFHELRRNGINHHIGTRYFSTRPKLDWVLPVYKLITKEEKIKISEPRVVCIGRFYPKNIKLFELNFKNFNEIKFIFIDRYINEYKSLYNKYTNITCIDRMNTEEMIQLLKKSDYVLITEENPDHIEKSISASIPLGLNCLCNLILPEKMNKLYNFKSVITYDKIIELKKPNFDLIEKDLQELIIHRDKTFDKYLGSNKSNWEASMIVYLKNKRRLDNFIKIKNEIRNLDIFNAIDTINDYQPALNSAINNKLFTSNFLGYCETYKGKLGCALSHIYLWHTFLNQSDKNWLLVLEDDIYLNNYNDKVIDEISDISEKIGCQFVQLFTNKKYYQPQLSSLKICSIKNKDSHYILLKMIPQWGTVSYLISKIGIKILLSKLPYNDNIDVSISKYTNELNALCLINDMIINKGADNANDKSSEFGSIIWEN